MKKGWLTSGILFILLGIGLIGYPAYHHWQQGQEIEELYSAINAISTDSEIEDKEIPPEIKEKVKAGVMRLEIPSIDLNQPILPETNDENLNIALTEIKQDQVPGEGNFTVAGHRSTKDGRHFNRLPSVVAGDEIFLIDEGKEYRYIVKSIETVEPEKVSVLDDVENEKLITLVTCNLSGSKRVIVQGELKEVKPL
jgi:sortase A